MGDWVLHIKGRENNQTKWTFLSFWQKGKDTHTTMNHQLGVNITGYYNILNITACAIMNSYCFSVLHI